MEREEIVEEYRNRIKGMSKEQAVKELETCLFYLQMDNFMDWDRYYSCKKVLKEIEDEKED